MKDLVFGFDVIAVDLENIVSDGNDVDKSFTYHPVEFETPHQKEALKYKALYYTILEYADRFTKETGKPVTKVETTGIIPNPYRIVTNELDCCAFIRIS